MLRGSVDFDPNGYIKGLDHNLLSPEQEKQLAFLIQQWLKWEDGKENAPEVIKDLGVKARDLLIKNNRRLVHTIVRRYNYKSYNIDLETTDLFQYGILGLIKAAENFDHNKNVRFSTFAFFWIRQAINRGLHSNRGLVRVPVHLSEKITKIKRFSANFSKVNKRLPSKQELMVGLNMPEETIDKLNGYFELQCHTSFECIKVAKTSSSVYSEDHPTLLDSFKPNDTNIILATKNQDVTIEKLVEEEDYQVVKTKLRSLFRYLNADQKFVLTHLFGLFGKEILKPEQIAEMLNEVNGADCYNKQEVSKIKSSALAKLKRMVKEAKQKKTA